MSYTIDESDVDELEYLCEMVMYLTHSSPRTRDEAFVFESISFRLGAVLDRLERDKLLAEKEKPTDEDYMAAMGPCGK